MNQKGKNELGEALDDRIVRLIGIPFFGVVIPSATGLVRFDSSQLVESLLHFGYFILLAFLVWQGNRWLLIKFYPIFYNSDSALQKYVLMVGVNILYTGPLASLMLFGWRYFTGNDQVPNQTLLITAVTTVVCVIFVTNIYEKVLFIAQRDQSKVRTAELEQAKIQAELDALKSQIDPHFIFNSLNGLSHLVESDPAKAHLFIENLADIYRYILKSKDRNLVFLKDEIQFIEAYALLMGLRYEGNFVLDVQVDESTQHDYLIPPVSLMVAVENAAKHNEISAKKPLGVKIYKAESNVVVYNAIAPKRNAYESTKLGLENLNDRFLKTMDKAIEIGQDDTTFLVKMPVIKLQDG